MHPIPAAKDALKAILNARSPWTAVEVKDGSPTEGEDFDYDAFWFEATEIPSDHWAQLGARGRRVEFRLGFTINVIRQGDDERAVEDIVWTLYEDLLAALKANPNLTDTIQQIGDVTGRHVSQPLNKTTWQSVFNGSIGCTSKQY